MENACQILGNTNVISQTQCHLLYPGGQRFHLATCFFFFCQSFICVSQAKCILFLSENKYFSYLMLWNIFKCTKARTGLLLTKECALLKAEERLTAIFSGVKLSWMLNKFVAPRLSDVLRWDKHGPHLIKDSAWVIIHGGKAGKYIILPGDE